MNGKETEPGRYAGQYPMVGEKRLDLRPGSEHTLAIVRELRKRVEWSDSALAPSMPRNREMDRILTGYMPEDAYDRAVKSKDPRKQLTFVVPMTFAMRETFQTVYGDTFCRGDAIHLYRGFGAPESRVVGALYERAVARQSNWFRERLSLDTLLGDAVTYGRSRGVIRWRKHKGVEVEQAKMEDLLAMIVRANGAKVSDGQIVDYVRRRTLFEGNEVQPISIYNQIIDPRSSVNQSNDAEYGGWRWGANLYQILRWETDPEERFFNADFVADRNAGDSNTPNEWWGGFSDARGGEGRSSDTAQYDDSKPDSVRLVTVGCELIPRRWFGEGFPDTPVRMQFTIAPGDVIVQGHMLDHWHGMWSFVDCAPNDGHLTVPTSHLQTTYAFQQFASWLMKSRAQAVLTLLNGKVIVNNDKLNISDFKRTDVGGIVRLKAGAYADTDISKLVHQLTFQDPTANHFGDMAQIDQIARMGNGINDAVMGQIRSSSDRVTATEVNNAKNQGFNRLARLALIIDEQMMRPMGFQFAHNTRQWMSEDVFVPLVGERYEAELRRQYGVEAGHAEIRVGRDAFSALFECEPRTALRPGLDDVSAMTELLKPMLAIDGVPQQISSDYRISDVFANVMQKMGLENISDFRNMKIQVLPDEQVMQQADAGNLVGGPGIGMPSGGGASPIPALPFMGTPA